MLKLIKLLATVFAFSALVASANPAYADGNGTCTKKINCKVQEGLCIALFDAGACGVWALCCPSSSNSGSGGPPQTCKNGLGPICYPECDAGTCQSMMDSLQIHYSGFPTIATNLGPASATANQISVEVAVDTSGKILYNWWFVGKGGRGWSELTSGWQTHDEPAVSAVPITGDTYIFAGIRGLDGNLYLNQGAVSGPFVGWQALNMKSPYAPALSSSGKTTVAVASDAAGHVLYNFWKLGSAGGGWKDLGLGRPKSKPAAALIGDYLFVVIQGPDDQLYMNQGTLGGTFVGWQRMGFLTNAAPAATSADNKAVVVATGANGHISYQWWTLGSAGTPWKDLGGEVWGSAPSATLASDSYLFVAAKGPSDHGLYLNQGTLGQPFVGWQKQ